MPDMPSESPAMDSTPALAGRLLRDWQFWLAVLLPLLFWIGWWLVLPTRSHSFPTSLWLNQVFLIPLIEELIFRGWLQGHLLRSQKMRRHCCGISFANLATALLFTLAHFFTHPPLWAFAVIVPALVFGYFRERHHSLYPAIFLHVYYNGGYFAIIG